MFLRVSLYVLGGALTFFYFGSTAGFGAFVRPPLRNQSSTSFYKHAYPMIVGRWEVYGPPVSEEELTRGQFGSLWDETPGETKIHLSPYALALLTTFNRQSRNGVQVQYNTVLQVIRAQGGHCLTPGILRDGFHVAGIATGELEESVVFHDFKSAISGESELDRRGEELKTFFRGRGRGEICDDLVRQAKALRENPEAEKYTNAVGNEDQIHSWIIDGVSNLLTNLTADPNYFSRIVDGTDFSKEQGRDAIFEEVVKALQMKDETQNIRDYLVLVPQVLKVFSIVFEKAQGDEFAVFYAAEMMRKLRKKGYCWHCAREGYFLLRQKYKEALIVGAERARLAAERAERTAERKARKNYDECKQYLHDSGGPDFG